MASEIMLNEWLDHLIIIGATILAYILLNYLRNIRRRNKLLASYGPNICIPPHHHSYVPFLGSAVEMGKGIRLFIDKYSTKFGEPLFTANIAGKHSLFIGDSDHLTMIYTHSRQVDGFALQKQFTRNVLGITSASDELAMFGSDSKAAIKQYHKYLFTDEELNKTVKTAQDIFNTLLPQLTNNKSTDGWYRHDLYRLVRTCIFEASVEPFLSKYIATQENSELFSSFDAGVPLMFGNAPSFLTKDATSARNTLLKRISDSKFIDQGSELIKDRQNLNLPDNVYQRTALGLLFASVGNSIPSVFWCLYHILSDPVAYDSIQNEVDGIIEKKKQTGEGDMLVLSLEELQGMKLLSSTFSESLRLYHGAFTVREATDNFVYDTKKKGQHKYLIEKGTRIMAFQSTLHHNSELFDEPETFQYDRFVHKNTDKDIRPFGGGSRLCPGRKFIRFEVQAFISMLMVNFDMRIVDGESKPDINYAMQGVGVSQPDRKVMIEIRPKP